MLGRTVTKPQARIIRAKTKCPDCGKEFDVEIQVEQQVAGAVTGFSAYSGSGGILSQCPWSVKK